MSKTVQWKRGNTLVSSTYVGAQGEITVNTDTWALSVHDGVQPGGYPVSGGNIGNVSLGNLTINGQTISGTVVDDNIVLNPLGPNSEIQFNSNVFNLVGKDTDTVLTSRILGNEFGPGSIAQLVLQNSNSAQPRTLSISANSQSPGLVINSDGFVGLNSTLGGYTFRVGGSISATEYYASADFPTGYQFTTPDGDTGLSHVYDTSQGNVSVVRIRHASVEVAKFQDNLTTQLTGNLVVSSQNAIGSFPTAFISMYSNVDSYSQLINQNINSGPNASSDFVATADNGNDSSYFVDLGIASSTYNYPGYDIIKPNDIYLLAVGENGSGPSTETAGNLIIGSTNGAIKLFVGNTAEANVVSKITTEGIIPGANVTYSLGSQDYQWKDLWVSNNTIYLGGFPINVSEDGILSVNNVPVTSATDRLINNGYEVILETDGNLTIPTDKVIRYPSGTVYGGGGALNIEIDGGYPSSIFDGTSLVIDGGVV